MSEPAAHQETAGYNENGYADLTEALNGAGYGETVILLADCAVQEVVVTPEVTLDLGGFDMTADFAVGLDTAHIIDSVGTGKLIINAESLVLDEENAMIPIYDGEGIKINAMAYPVNMDVVELLKNDSADNNIRIVIRLTWDNEETVGSQEFVFNDEVVAQVYNSNDGSWSGYGKQFAMVITDFESITNLKAQVVVSGTDTEYVSSQFLSIT